MKASELIAALEDGKTLDKDYKLAFPELYQFHEVKEHVESFYRYEQNGRVYFERKGWGSALGKTEDVVMEILEHPERWAIRIENHLLTKTIEK